MRLRHVLSASLLLAACTDPIPGTGNGGALDGGGSTHDGVDATASDLPGVDGAAHPTPPSLDAGRPADAGVPRDGGTGGAVTVPSAISALFPAGFSVSSPLAQKPLRPQFRVDPNLARTPGERVAQISSVLAGTVIDDCGVMLSGLAMMGSGDNVTCYGPQLDYTGHPDATGGAIASGQLPGGDLGLWTSTEASGEACAAAKLNALIAGIARKVDFGLYASASMVCSGRVAGLIGAKLAAADGGVGDAGANDAGTASPAFLGLLNLKTQLTQALSSDASLSVTSATLERLEDSAGEFFHYILDLTVTPGMMPGGGGPTPAPRTIRTELIHHVDPIDSGTYHGRMWSVSGSGTDREAYSVSYQRNALTGRLRYHTVAANYGMGSLPSFDSEGHLQINSNWAGNATQGIFDLSIADGTGNVSFAWQAGTGDSHARVFHAYTQQVGGTNSGCGFFSYGSRFDKSGATWPSNAFQTFICNWAGPGNQHTGRVGYAQKQCMAFDAMGKYVPSTDAIRYAPVNSCDSTSTSFAYKLTSASSYSTSALTSALVQTASDADYAGFVAPAPLF